tara:strand:+ start:2960 stop:3466 length:507 start_codon:yes stop_codon:yes gene_type:complete
MANVHQEYNGMKFIFGYFDPEDKCWVIPCRRFLLTKDTNTNNLRGQFIQSNWYNRLYRIGDELHFVVMSIEKNKSLKDVEKDMNKLKNPFPTFHDVPVYTKNVGYYIMDQTIMMRCIKQLYNDFSFMFTLKSMVNPYQSLTLKFIRNDDNPQTMFICCPEFQNKLDYC